MSRSRGLSRLDLSRRQGMRTCSLGHGNMNCQKCSMWNRAPTRYTPQRETGPGTLAKGTRALASPHVLLRGVCPATLKHPSSGRHQHETALRILCEARQSVSRPVLDIRFKSCGRETHLSLRNIRNLVPRM